MKGIIVLVVEDEPAMSIVLQAALQREGIDARVAKDGNEGIKMAMELHPDLILLDILMPKMDGLTMLTNLRKDPWGATARVIVLSNYMDKEKQNAASSDGVTDYWLKTNLSLEEIVERVKTRLPVA